jgi:hypothetical protein
VRDDIEKLKEMGASVCFSEFHNTVVIVVNGHKFIGRWENAICDAYKYFTEEFISKREEYDNKHYIKEAKELTIEVWTYFAEHPEIRRKYELPKILYEKIEYLCNECPLCVLFLKGHEEKKCEYCPLNLSGHKCRQKGSYFYCWYNAKTKEERIAAAWGIVNITKEWAAGDNQKPQVISKSVQRRLDIQLKRDGK